MRTSTKIAVAILIGVAVFLIDQYIKQIFLDGFRWYSDYIDLILVFNKGVAFGSFAFLAENLKYLQIILLVAVVGYVIKIGALSYALPVAILVSAGASNVYDRFLHEGVVDYVFYHHWFEFAVFNFADVMIDVAVAWILIQHFIEHRRKQKEQKL